MAVVGIVAKRGLPLLMLAAVAYAGPPHPSARVEVRERVEAGGSVAYEYTVVNTSAAEDLSITDWAIGLRGDLIHGELKSPPGVRSSDWEHQTHQGPGVKGGWYVWWTCDASLGRPGYSDRLSPGGLREHQGLVDACAIKPGRQHSFVLHTRPADASYGRPAFAVFFGSAGVFGRAEPAPRE